MRHFRAHQIDIRQWKICWILKVTFSSLMRMTCRDGIGPPKEVHLKSENQPKPMLSTKANSYSFRAAHAPSISGSADSRVMAVRDRLNIIRQTVLRNDHFSPSTIPSKDRDRLLTARSFISTPSAWISLPQ